MRGPSRCQSLPVAYEASRLGASARRASGRPTPCPWTWTTHVLRVVVVVINFVRRRRRAARCWWRRVVARLLLGGAGFRSAQRVGLTTAGRVAAGPGLTIRSKRSADVRMVCSQVEAQDLWVYRRDAAASAFSDRYAIRTRNLQDWNLTRYRCANRSKAPTTDAAVHRSPVARDRHVFHDAAALALVFNAPAC